MNEINKEERMQGLSGQQVSESKAKYGTNELAKKETESLWSMFIGAFDDIWIKVLCAALDRKSTRLNSSHPSSSRMPSSA